tara:strand:+ start:4578 stop:5150 length:573 start_codon:yes stop_codon:yes gene_type:complete
MSSLEKQILKLSDKYIKMFITHIVTNKIPLDEEQLMISWKEISKPGSKTNTGSKRKSGYIIYLVEQRPLIAKENPELKSTEIVSIIASKWREMSTEEKDVYNKKAKNEQQEQQQEQKSAQLSEQNIDTDTDTDNSEEERDNKHEIFNEGSFENLNIKQLKSLCEKYELFTIGKKQELIERLNTFRENMKN